MASTPSSPTQRRPCTLDMDGGSHRATVTCTPSAVDRLLSEIAFQRHRERQLMANGSRHRRRQRGDGLRAGATSTGEFSVAIMFGGGCYGLGILVIIGPEQVRNFTEKTGSAEAPRFFTLFHRVIDIL